MAAAFRVKRVVLVARRVGGSSYSRRMKRLLLLLPLIALVGCSSSTPPSTLVALISHTAPVDDVASTHFCGGVLVAPALVATAAHCLTGRAPSSIDAIVGADNLCSTAAIGGTRSAVTAFEPLDTSADIALIRLASPSAVMPTTLATSVSEPVAWGWGTGSPGGVGPCSARAVALTVTDECVGAAAGSLDDYLCAVPTGELNTCTGDSGGPVFVDGALLAIVSSGAGCGPDDSGYYTRASLLEPAIER